MDLQTGVLLPLQVTCVVFNFKCVCSSFLEYKNFHTIAMTNSIQTWSQQELYCS